MATVLARPDVSWVEATAELDDHQAGALRRILNLSRQLTGDWSGMLSDTVMGESYGAFRFQLAYMSYALGLAHAHRLPAAPGVFHKPFDNLIQKMLLPDVWAYWSNVSTGGGAVNHPMGKLEQRWDPIAEDNIMYSAYVQSMALMYHYLFRDDKYSKEGSLTLRLETHTWNDGGYCFPYDEKSVNEAVYWQMAEKGFLGVACEPGCIFQICNQPNILGFRFHDLIYGTNFAQPAMEGYKNAWERFGLVDDAGDFQVVYLTFTDDVLNVASAKLNFWLMTLLHSWYPEIVEKNYATICERYIVDGPDGTKWIRPKKTIDNLGDAKLTAADMGWAVCTASELGDQAMLDAIFRYADRYQNPVWENGAYYYKRQDEKFNEDGLFIGMDPHTGNALTTYARLNVKDGLKKLFDGPWDDAHFSEPALVGLPDFVDVRRALFSNQHNALALTLGALPDTKSIRLEVRAPAHNGVPVLVRDGEIVEKGVSRLEDLLVIDLDLHEKTTLVLQW